VWIADTQDPVNLPGHLSVGMRGWFRKRCTLPSLERFLVKHADVFIANTPQARILLQKRYPRWRNKIEVLPNGFDPESRLTAAAIPARDYVVLSHYGDLYSFRHPGKLLESLDRLQEAQQVSPAHLRVDLVGEADDQWVGFTCERMKQLLGRSWVRHVASRVPRSEARKATAEADYLLLVDVQGPLSQYFMPAKIYDYITVGRPILCFTERSSPADQLLAIAGIPHVIVYYDDSPAVTDNKVASFFQLPKDPTRPSACFEQDCSGRTLTMRLASIYRNACGLERQ
jgi:glycosyltransferase involved in cell wall biosynthesis